MRSTTETLSAEDDTRMAGIHHQAEVLAIFGLFLLALFRLSIADVQSITAPMTV
jgi:hypothetical protein